MLSSSQVAQVYGVFQSLLNDLEPFVNVSEMRLAFDKGGNAFLVAPDFSEPLTADPTLHRQVREEMRQVIAKHRSIHSDPFATP